MAKKSDKMTTKYVVMMCVLNALFTVKARSVSDVFKELGYSANPNSVGFHFLSTRILCSPEMINRLCENNGIDAGSLERYSKKVASTIVKVNNGKIPDKTELIFAFRAVKKELGFYLTPKRNLENSFKDIPLLTTEYLNKFRTNKPLLSPFKELVEYYTSKR